MQSYYSFYGSRMHIILDDELAQGYNRRVDQFLAAQMLYEEMHGEKWDPKEPLLMESDEQAEKAWNDIARLFNLIVEINGDALDIPEEEITSDYLVKL